MVNTRKRAQERPKQTSAKGLYNILGKKVIEYCYILGFLGGMTYAPYCISMVAWQWVCCSNTTLNGSISMDTAV
jgi:hypothetical protein